MTHGLRMYGRLASDAQDAAYARLSNSGMPLLRGSVAFFAVATTLISSLMMGPSSAVFGNTIVGKRLLRPHELLLIGTVQVRHTTCWLRLDAPSEDIRPGESIGLLPVDCDELHYPVNLVSRSYQVDINPGLLGVPFVESVYAANISGP